MRILVISNTFWSIHNFRNNFIKAFTKDNRVIIASSKDNSLKKLKKIGSEIKLIDIISKSTNPINEIKLLIQLNKMFNLYKPDVVLNFTIKPIIYSSLLLKNKKKVKVINTLDGFGLSLTKNFFFKKLIFILFKISQKKIFKFYSVTSNDFKLIKTNNLVPKKKLFQINGTGINLNHYKYLKPNLSKKTTFLFVGRFLILKGIRLFVNASAMVNQMYKDTKFLAIGEFTEDKYSISKKELQNWKSENIVQFIKPVNDIRKIIKKSDCIVLPTSYPEGINRSILEAISMGKPSITNKIGGCTHLIKNNFNGYIKNIKNEKDLANMMIKFHNLSNKDKLRFSTNGRKFVEKNFNEENIIRKYLKDFK